MKRQEGKRAIIIQAEADLEVLQDLQPVRLIVVEQAV